MLSKNKQKFILSLNRKKIRDQHQVFIAEGEKLIEDLLKSEIKVETIICTKDWLTSNTALIPDGAEIVTGTLDEIKKVSGLKSPPPVLGLFQQKQNTLNTSLLAAELSLFLDDIQDPGNLGTIIRLADWFGIKSVICTTGCADVYNSKTVQSTMGAISRVNVYYTESEAFFNDYAKVKLPVYGTFLDGNNLYEQGITENGLIIMGNEGKGISSEVEKHVTHKLLIPSFPGGIPSSESLNVSVATAIVCAEFRRPKA